MSEPVRIGSLDALADGEVAAHDVDGRPIAVARVGERCFAFDDTCTHARVSLAGGIVDSDDCTIECPKHGALFSLETGEALTLPATRGVATHELEVIGNEIFVTLADQEEDG